jgi:hypothetical protein
MRHVPAGEESRCQGAIRTSQNTRGVSLPKPAMA